MRFSYKHLAIPSPAISLGGRWVRPRPIIGITIIGPVDSRLQEGLLDTGADDTVFPENLANAPLRYAQVHLRITDGYERREWPAWVGFTPAKLHLPLLGFAGFLQLFTAAFRGDHEQVELTVNNLYPGT